MSEKDEQAPVEVTAYNGRPADKPAPNTTFADRAKAAQKSDAAEKAVAADAAEDKAVSSASSKSRKSSR